MIRRQTELGATFKDWPELEDRRSRTAKHQRHYYNTITNHNPGQQWLWIWKSGRTHTRRRRKHTTEIGRRYLQRKREPDVPTATTECDVHWMQYAPAKKNQYSRLWQCIHVLERAKVKQELWDFKTWSEIADAKRNMNCKASRIGEIQNELHEGWTELLHCRWTGLCVLSRNLTFTMSDWTLKFYFFWFHENIWLSFQEVTFTDTHWQSIDNNNLHNSWIFTYLIR